MNTRVDTLIHSRWVIPVEPARLVLEHHSVAIDKGRIVAVMPTPQAQSAYTACAEVALDEHVLIPGLVNLHTHAAMTLMRGIADDLPLMEWLQKHIWPVEMKHASPRFVRDGTRLACVEMLRGGVTCFNDMYFFPEDAAAAALECGMRAALGIIVIEFPTPYATDPDDYLRKGLEARDRYRDEDLISFCMAPHAPYTVSDRTFERIATLSAQLDLPVHIHVHETRDEIEQSLRQHGVRPLQRLASLGLVNPGLLAVHAIHVDESEIALLADNGCAVAHCPTSNLKLASGIAPVAALAAAGVTVGIGSDGAASNNRLDILSESRIASLLAKGSSGDARAIDAHTALRMATLEGARALHLADRIGSIVPGKSADLCAVSIDSPETRPCYDPASHLLHAAGREHVSDVWVEGRRIVECCRITTIKTPELLENLKIWQNRLSS